MLLELVRPFATWFLLGCVSSVAGIAVAQPSPACLAGTECCQNPIPACYLISCAAKPIIGECNCCFCAGSGTNKCLNTNSNGTPPYGCDQACIANP